MKTQMIICFLFAGSAWVGGGNIQAQEARFNTASGSVHGRNSVGGLVGRVDASSSLVAENAVAGPVSGEREVGGFIGSNSGEVVHGYARGQVLGAAQVGGFAGVNRGEITGSYWDINRSGQTGSAGGEGRSTDDMTYPYAANTYVGWNFSTIWHADVLPWQNDGYPWLAVSDVYKLDVRVFPGGAGVAAGSGYFKSNTVAPLDAVPNAGYIFKGWQYNGVMISADPGFMYPVTAHATLTAVFEEMQTGVADQADVRYAVHVFPNPASGSIQVDIGAPEAVNGIIIANLLGQPMNVQRFSGAPHERIRIDVSRLTPGIYFLVVEFEGSRAVRKVIVQ